MQKVNLGEKNKNQKLKLKPKARWTEAAGAVTRLPVTLAEPLCAAEKSPTQSSEQ